jgi:hypothetical protein
LPEGADRTQRVPRERRHTGQRLEQDEAEGPHIRPPIECLYILELLRGTVGGRAHQALRPRGDVSETLRRLDPLGNSEIENLDARRPRGDGGEEEIGRLDVAVDQPEGMRLLESGASAQHIVHCDRCGQTPTRLEHCAQIHAHESFQHQERHTGVQTAHVHDAHYMIPVECLEAGGLAQKLCHQLFELEKLLAQQFQRNGPTATGVFGLVDPAHATGAQQAYQAVGTRVCAPGE